MWCVAPLVMNEGKSLGGKGTIGLQAAVPKWPHTRPLTFYLSPTPLQSHYGPGDDTAPNRNEYREYFLGRKPGIFSGAKGDRCIGLTILPPSCANCLEIQEPQPPGTLMAMDCFTFPDHI